MEFRSNNLRTRVDNIEAFMLPPTQKLNEGENPWSYKYGRSPSTLSRNTTDSQVLPLSTSFLSQTILPKHINIRNVLISATSCACLTCSFSVWFHSISVCCLAVYEAIKMHHGFQRVRQRTQRCKKTYMYSAIVYPSMNRTGSRFLRLYHTSM